MDDRAKWSRRGVQPQYCSQRCRQHRPNRVDAEIESTCLRLMEERPKGSICPSEVARAVRPQDWRPLMERCRQAARRLAHQGLCEILKQGKVIEPHEIHGPIRLRIKKAP